MLQKTLKALLIIMLMILFAQRVIQPAMNEAKLSRNQLASVRSSLQHIATNDAGKIHALLQTENQMISAYLQQINSVLPDYQTTRVGAIGNLESLREKFHGKWQIQPSTQPIVDEKIVKWPVRLVFESDFHSALKLLESIEIETSLNRIISVDFNSGKTTETELIVNLELLFSNSSEPSEQQVSTKTLIGGAM